MAAATCLPRETLKQYLVGDFEESQTEAIESHIASCPECEQTVVELEANPDTLMVGIRALPEQQVQQIGSSAAKVNEEPSVVKQALAAVRQLPDTSPKHLSEWPVGQIGAYELLRPLGRGGMGMVVLARHRSLQKEVAIKLLSSLLGDKPELVTRFQREMRAAGRLQHPAIVNATDAGQERGTHYLVMEYVAGLDLSRIARLVGRLSIADACELMRQTALGLSHAHAEGIVHRDVKPSNLMLDATGHVKILDFGLAQINLWDEPVCELTTVGQLMGTIDYMAPEQAERIGAVDYRADLYALGATLFRLIAGRAPLAASPNMTLLEKVRLLGSQTSPLLSSVREDCPPELVQLVSQLLSRDPAARPASAAHVAQALEPFCSGSQLVELLTNAQAAAVADPVAEPAVESAMPSLAQSSSLQFAETVGSSRTPTKPPIGRWLWTAAAALPLMILAGILITIETQKGQLVIQSDVADVQIKVARDGKVVDELTVQPGAQSTRLRADKYEIMIDSPSDQVVVDKQLFSIKSGETVVATIKQVEQGQATLPFGESKAVPNSDEPTYELVSYKEWLHVLSTDTSAEKQKQAFEAIAAIGTKRSIEDARPVIVDVLRSLSKSLRSNEVTEVGFGVLCQSFANREDYHRFLASELQVGSASWQLLLLDSARSSYDNSSAPLVEAVMKVATGPNLHSSNVRAAAAEYLCSFLESTRDDSTLEMLQREVADSLEKNAGLDFDFWYECARNHKWLSSRHLADLVANAATRLANKGNAKPESMLRALRVLAIYNKPLSDTSWIERYAEVLLNDPDRMKTVYFVDQRSGINLPPKVEICDLSLNQGYEFRANRFSLMSANSERMLEAVELLSLLAVHDLVPQLRPMLQRFEASALPEFRDVLEMQKVLSENGYYSASLRNLVGIPEEARVLAVIACAAKHLLAIRKPQNSVDVESQVEDSKAIVSQPSPQDFIKSLRGGTAGQSLKEPTNETSAEPLFDGRTLSQWFEMLERDRDVSARSTAMKAIGKLTDKAEVAKITERLMVIARQANSLQEWSDYTSVVDLVMYGSRRTPFRETLDKSLIDLLIVLNDKEWFQKFLVTDLLKGDDTWTARWLAALLLKQNSRGDSEYASVIYERFKDKEAFDALGPNSAWLAQAWLVEHLGSNETIAKENVEHVLTLIEGQPHLGKLAVLQVDAEIHTRFETISSDGGDWLGANPNPAHHLVDEAVAKYAKKILESDESSPEAVARAASRLASTTEIVDGWRAELLKVIRKRLGVLASDHDRLTAMLPIEQQRGPQQFYKFPQRNPTDRPSKLPIPFSNRFSMLGSTGMTIGRDGVQRLFSVSDYRKIGMVPPYVESECVALIATMIRLEGASECEKELTSIAEATWPDFDSLMTQTGSRTINDPDGGSRQAEPWSKISNETWLGWAIHRILFEHFAGEKEQLPQLSRVLNRTVSRLSFLQADQNSDGKLSSEELPQQIRSFVDEKTAVSIDFNEFAAITQIVDEIPKPKLDLQKTSNQAVLAWAKKQIAKYDTNGDGKLTADEATRSATEKPIVKQHPFRGKNLDTAYQVVSLLLNGLPEVRLAKDENAKTLILMARDSEHKLVEDTLNSLLATESPD